MSNMSHITPRVERAIENDVASRTRSSLETLVTVTVADWVDGRLTDDDLEEILISASTPTQVS